MPCAGPSQRTALLPKWQIRQRRKRPTRRGKTRLPRSASTSVGPSVEHGPTPFFVLTPHSAVRRPRNGAQELPAIASLANAGSDRRGRFPLRRIAPDRAKLPQDRLGAGRAPAFARRPGGCRHCRVGIPARSRWRCQGDQSKREGRREAQEGSGLGDGRRRQRAARRLGGRR